MIRSLKLLLTVATALILFSACGDSHSTESISTDNNMCKKFPMQSDGIVRLSKIQVNPEYLDEYMKYAVEVGTVSLETEPGVLTMYAVADKENPCNITILETYASQEAYKSHIASEHFQKYKQGTLHMVDSLLLDDVTPLNPNNVLTNVIKTDIKDYE
ncbi:MAG: antibiotic biosynthesis monooxygenase [Muribaculaceae bacterium]|nr:antibiotic biosynthesis monooxygenase [Muribaculaceae bacterium]